MSNEEVFDYLDHQGRPATVALSNIARFTTEFNEDLGRNVGHLHPRSGADVWTSDPDGVRERLCALQETGKWKGFLG